MPKTRYIIDDRTFVWTSDDDDKVRIPLRVPMEHVLAFADVVVGDSEKFRLLVQMDDNLEPVLKRMDRNDFVAMFDEWLTCYYGGVGLGESEASSS